MEETETSREENASLRVTWDAAARAGYLYLTDIADGEAVHQRVVHNPVRGRGDVVLDFDRKGRLLGVEFLDRRLLPRSMKQLFE